MKTMKTLFLLASFSLSMLSAGETVTTEKLMMTSSVFKNGERIPTRHTGEGDDLSPKLAWSGVPNGTKSFALMCDDPDAPGSKPWVHWILFNIPAETRALDESVGIKNMKDLYIF